MGWYNALVHLEVERRHTLQVSGQAGSVVLLCSCRKLQGYYLAMSEAKMDALRHLIAKGFSVERASTKWVEAIELV